MSAALPVIPVTALQEGRRRFDYMEAPDTWISGKLRERIWSGQRKVLERVRDHRRVAVASCHEAGKSYIASRAAAWWLDIWPAGEAFVVTTAPSGPQVKAILWKEIGRAHAKGKLRGRTNQTEWHMRMPDGNEELVAFGRKPADYSPTSFQGIHARRVLVIFDEACGIPGAGSTHSLWDAADSLIANEYSRFLAIGNPDDNDSEFARACTPGSGWEVVNISAFDTPNFTGEPVPPRVSEVLVGRTWVEEKRRKWAPAWVWVDAHGEPSTPEEGVRCVPPEGKKETDSNPLWQSKVLGVFPEHATKDTLIPFSWVAKAQARELEPGEPNELGVDVGAGGDASCVAHRRGSVVRIKHEDHNPDTMQTCGTVIALMKATGATKVKVDRIGIGAGITDRGRELGHPFEGINVGEASANSEDYLNLRAELYWGLRERFEQGDMDLDPLDDDTAAELCSLRYKRTSRGQIQIESKDEAKRRGVPSPNRAEAVMLACASPSKAPAQKFEVLW